MKTASIVLPVPRESSDNLYIDLVAAESRPTVGERIATSVQLQFGPTPKADEPTIDVEELCKQIASVPVLSPSKPQRRNHKERRAGTHRPVGYSKTHRNTEKANKRASRHQAHVALTQLRVKVTTQLAVIGSEIDEGLSWVEEVFGPQVAVDLP